MAPAPLPAARASVNRVPTSSMAHASRADSLPKPRTNCSPADGGIRLQRLLVRSLVQLVRPGAAMLLMQLPARFGDGVRVQQSVRAGIRCTLRIVGSHGLAVDTTIHHVI